MPSRAEDMDGGGMLEMGINYQDRLALQPRNRVVLNDLSFGAEPGLHERGELRKFKSGRHKMDAR